MADVEWFEQQPWVPEYSERGECSVCGAIVGWSKMRHSAFHAYVWRLVAGQQAINDEQLTELRSFFAKLDRD